MPPIPERRGNQTWQRPSSRLLGDIIGPGGKFVGTTINRRLFYKAGICYFLTSCLSGIHNSIFSTHWNLKFLHSVLTKSDVFLSTETQLQSYQMKTAKSAKAILKWSRPKKAVWSCLYFKLKDKSPNQHWEYLSYLPLAVKHCQCQTLSLYWRQLVNEFN